MSGQLKGDQELHVLSVDMSGRSVSPSGSTAVLNKTAKAKAKETKSWKDYYVSDQDLKTAELCELQHKC
jgi:hypothetical protein